ncbi:Predicted dehydrogenase [Paramicrobacterium humi]|uniref:Predicted dehydrogenase n=1 Tax=Paramicrobacterium humi TaxID=640635 RepID=A0A1H4LN28_9MICO|nr:Gfo/Idh/MocA family oxidoreductase [Microbacterium humi]SEB71692.1 Predicted dehydrogenase [Microbacterium humi]
MQQTRWAVLGPGVISTDFVEGLRHSEHGMLHAVGSSSPERAAAFAAKQGAAASGTYADIIARDDVDAVYIGTVHTTHVELAIRALDAGKAVLCEKPASPTLAETQRILDAAARAKRPFLEAFKNRFGPFAEAVRSLVAGGELGAPARLEAACGFAAGTRTGRLFDPELAGGAILDVGCYPVSLAVEIAAAAGLPFDAPELISSTAEHDAGVETDAAALVEFGGFEAQLSTSIVRTLDATATLRFTGGEVILPSPWGSRVDSARSLIVRRDGDEQTIEVPIVQPMAAEADAVSRALADGRCEVPEMPWSHTAAVARVLTLWRYAAS